MFCASASLRRRPASLASLLVAPPFRPPFVCLALEIPEAVDTRDKSGGSVLRRRAGTAGGGWWFLFHPPLPPPPGARPGPGPRAPPAPAGGRPAGAGSAGPPRARRAER